MYSGYTTRLHLTPAQKNSILKVMKSTTPQKRNIIADY